MTVVKLHSANPDSIAAAANRLRGGRLVAFATETVYGLGADATDESAVARIFAVKNRPHFNPLISHVPDAAAAMAIGRFNENARRITDAFWPGPLTIVVERGRNCPVAWLATAGLDSVAIRVPGHPGARDLLRRVGRPVAAPSANRSGRISPTRAEHVAAELVDDDILILDGGPCAAGLESTVIDLSGAVPRLLRPGVVTREDLETVLGPVAGPRNAEPVVAPGMLASHYAPDRPLRLDAAAPLPGEAFLGFGENEADDAGASLSPNGDLAEAAANLFHLLRHLDQPDVVAIAVAPIPDHGLGAAINDRLRRAAAPR